MRTKTVIGTLAVLTFLVSGCGSDDAPSGPPTPETPSSKASSTPPVDPGSTMSLDAQPVGPVVEVTISGDRVEAPGDRVMVKVGEPVTFDVTSDRAGELHVHSSPEQTPGFDIGQSSIAVTIERPGLIEVEEHESGELIAQLEVR